MIPEWGQCKQKHLKKYLSKISLVILQDVITKAEMRDRKDFKRTEL